MSAGQAVCTKATALWASPRFLEMKIQITSLLRPAFGPRCCWHRTTPHTYKIVQVSSSVVLLVPTNSDYLHGKKIAEAIGTTCTTHSATRIASPARCLHKHSLCKFAAQGFSMRRAARRTPTCASGYMPCNGRNNSSTVDHFLFKLSGCTLANL